MVSHTHWTRVCQYGHWSAGRLNSRESLSRDQPRSEAINSAMAGARLNASYAQVPALPPRRMQRSGYGGLTRRKQGRVAMEET